MNSRSWAPAGVGSILSLVLGLGCASGIWLAIALAADIGPGAWLAGHVALVGISAAANAWSTQKEHDAAPAFLVLTATLLLGPPGTLMAGIATLAAVRTEPDRAILEAWYARISDAGDVDRVTRLSAAVVMRRAIDTEAPLPSNFAMIMSEGSIPERQNALGLIARRFAPHYAPALKAALVSSEPVVRVQAAAVAVKVKSEIVLVLDTLAAASGNIHDPARAAEIAAELDAMIETGLLDYADAARAEAARRRLLDVATDLEFARPGLGASSWLSSASEEAVSLIETELLYKQRFAEFRTIRSMGEGRA